MRYVSALLSASFIWGWSYSEVASSVRMSLFKHTEDHKCLRETINIADFKQTHLQHVMHYAVGFQTCTILFLPLLSLLPSLSSPSLLAVLPHGWHRASEPTPGFPSYSKLNVFGGFNQGFAWRDIILHTKLKCISRGFMHKLFILEQCTAKSPLLIFGWLLCKSIPSGKAEEQLSCCHQLISRRCYYTPPSC